MFVSLCDALTADQGSQREGSVEGLSTIGEGLDFNTVVIKEVVADLQSAHIEFTKLQPKQQPNKDDGSPSFSPTLALREPDIEA